MRKRGRVLVALGVAMAVVPDIQLTAAAVAGVADEIYNRWKLQVEQFVALHKRDVLENLAVHGCVIAKVTGDANFDSITVRFDAIAKDYEVDDSGKMVSGDKRIRPFTEFWTFIRSQAARSRVGETAQITQCPNCGGPVSINDVGHLRLLQGHGDHRPVRLGAQQHHPGVRVVGGGLS